MPVSGKCLQFVDDRVDGQSDAPVANREYVVDVSHNLQWGQNLLIVSFVKERNLSFFLSRIDLAFHCIQHPRRPESPSKTPLR